jgi:hypothetical protein
MIDFVLHEHPHKKKFFCRFQCLDIDPQKRGVRHSSQQRVRFVSNFGRVDSRKGANKFSGRKGKFDLTEAQSYAEYCLID